MVDKRNAELAKEFGRLLRLRRIEMDLTLEGLSELVKISPDHLGKLERGGSTPSLDTMMKLKVGMNISIDRLLNDVYKVYNPFEGDIK
ncbi:helix-turn-helix domain-containing protein [Fredinandcohnia humi]